jgi:toxin ParE1/3/4
MTKFAVTRRARRDLANIWDYLRDHSSEATADRVLAEIYDAILLIADQPGMGHTRPDVTNHRYRFWTVYRYVIAYRTDCRPLTVSRVVHGSRDFTSLFR